MPTITKTKRDIKADPLLNKQSAERVSSRVWNIILNSRNSRKTIRMSFNTGRTMTIERKCTKLMPTVFILSSACLPKIIHKLLIFYSYRQNTQVETTIYLEIMVDRFKKDPIRSKDLLRNISLSGQWQKIDNLGILLFRSSQNHRVESLFREVCPFLKLPLPLGFDCSHHVSQCIFPTLPLRWFKFLRTNTKDSSIICQCANNLKSRSSDFNRKVSSWVKSSISIGSRTWLWGSKTNDCGIWWVISRSGKRSYWGRKSNSRRIAVIWSINTEILCWRSLLCSFSVINCKCKEPSDVEIFIFTPILILFDFRIIIVMLSP